MKRIVSFLILLIVFMTLSGCNEIKTNDDKITIATTFFPLYDLTKRIVGDSAKVYSVVPINTEPHEYETSPQDLVRLDRSDVFVTLGVEHGLAPFEERLASSASKKVKIVAAGRGIKQISPEQNLGDVSDEVLETGLDPHIWVSPEEAIKMAENIREGLIDADPHNKEIYSKNADELINDLKQLDSDFANGLSDCNKNVIIAAHDAFSYLARDYNFKSYYVDGLSPEKEPTPQQITRLANIAKEYDLKYLFYEETTDPRVSRTIAEQVGAQTLPLNPAEAAQDESETFISIMNENLENLRIAMECK